MKNCRRICVFFLLSFLAAGCSTFASKEKFSKRTSDSFCLVLARPYDPGLFSAPIKIDDNQVKLNRGSFLELELPAELHIISARHGRVLTRDYPPASTNVSGSPGERRYFSLVIRFRTIPAFIPLPGGGGFMLPEPNAIQASWTEISQEEFEHQFPHAKFNH